MDLQRGATDSASESNAGGMGLNLGEDPDDGAEECHECGDGYE